MTFRALVSLRVSVTREVPLAELDYVLMNVGARLDTTGLFRFIPELVAVVDGTAYSLAKPLTDNFVALDTTSVAALKNLSDGFAMNDGSEAVDGSTYSLHKGIQNVAFPIDLLAHAIHKALSSSTGTVDQAAKTAAKGISDAFGLGDAQTVAAEKALADVLSFEDVVDVLLTILRDFSDTVAAADDDTFVFTPATKVEQITVADLDNIDYQKNIADGFAMNDGSEAVDGSTYSFSKGISNVAFVGDVRSLIFTTSRVESVSVADAGLVSAQDYCDPTYFAEDYVGVSQSF